MGVVQFVSLVVYLISQAVQPKHERIHNWSFVMCIFTFVGAAVASNWFGPIQITLILGITYAVFALVVAVVSSKATDMMNYNYLRTAFWASFSLLLSVVMELVFPGLQGLFLGVFSVVVLLVTVDSSPEELTSGGILNWYSLLVSIHMASVLFWGRTI